MATLIAEDLLLLLLDPDKGTLAHGDKVQPVLGGALLTELALLGRVEVTERPNRWTAPKVLVAGGAAVDDELLGHALGVVAEKPRRADDLVGRMGKGMRQRLLERLAARGLVHPVRDKVLGLVPRTTWPAADRGHVATVRAAVQGVLVDGVAPDDRTAALVALLSAIGHAHRVVERGDVPAREVKRRAKEVADGAWAAGAVRDAVMAAQAGTAAAIAAGGAAAAASS